MSYVSNLENELYFRGSGNKHNVDKLDSYRDRGYSIDEAATAIIRQEQSERIAQRDRLEQEEMILCQHFVEYPHPEEPTPIEPDELPY